MDTLGQELDTALTAVEKERDCGCGCGGKKAAAVEAETGLAAELSAALDAVKAEDVFGGGDADDPFADLSMAGSGATLEEILAVAESHPGLKITFSF